MGNFTEELFIFLHQKVSQNPERKLRPHLLQVDNPFAIFAPLQLSGRTTPLEVQNMIFIVSNDFFVKICFKQFLKNQPGIRNQVEEEHF